MAPSLFALYVSECEKRKIKCNSSLYKQLNDAGSNETLKKLDLCNNYLGSEGGFDSFVAVVREAISLEEIDLTGVSLTTDNVRVLVEVALLHPKLHTLKVTENRLYIESGKELARLARFNPHMLVIEVADSSSSFSNKIPERLVKQIQTSLAHNRAAQATNNAQPRLDSNTATSN